MLNIIKNINPEEYNKIPVVYCKHCLSLRIMSSDDMEFCDECGSTDILTTDIYTWRELYKKKYNKEY